MNPGKLLAASFLGLLALGGLVAVMVAFQREASYASRAVMAQRVRPSSEASLFGDIGENIGSPTEYVVDDPHALLDHKGPGGVALLDESYLEKTGKYPLQMKTVRYVASMVKWGGALVAVVCGILAFLVLRGRRPVAEGGEPA